MKTNCVDLSGPAFPTLNSNPEQHGLTIRDYFASQAVSGYIQENPKADFLQIAELAYGLADAMLAERGRV